MNVIRQAPKALWFYPMFLIASDALANTPSVGPTTIDYASTHKISLTEAEDRLSKVAYIAALERRISIESPDTFAGLFIEHKPTFRAVVRFVGDASSQLAKYTLDPLFVPQKAPRPLELLIATQEHIAQQLPRAKLTSNPVSIFIDQK